MSTDNTFQSNPQKIKNIICNLYLGGDLEFPLEHDTDLLREGICDSLALVSLATQLEQLHPGLRIHDAEITHENMGSISRIQNFIEGKSGE